MSKAEAIREAASILTKRLSDEGKLIEAGWAVFALYVISKDAPKIQRDEMQIAYMAGAEHLFTSIMNVLDPGEEPTERDLSRMELIAKEMDVWRAKLSERVNPAQGHA
jgi:hypothetical protein